MPDQNDTGGARQCSRVARPVQVWRLLPLRALWLNRVQDWIGLAGVPRRRLQEAT